MDDVPEGFVADLRHLRPWPELADSLWRSPRLVELTYGRLWQLVAEALPAAPARVLDVGAGTGAVSLETARAGHDVTAIDPDATSVRLARRSAGSAAPGRVAYHEADVDSWEADEGGFDAVVVARVLQYVPDPDRALARVRRWLRPGGRLICVDVVHDRFDRRAARWLAQVRGLLEGSGRFRGAARLPADPEAASDRIAWEWEQEHVVEHDLNGSAQIDEPLRRLFHQTSRTWHAYLYWDLLVGLDAGQAGAGTEAEARLAELIAAWEASLLSRGELPGVLFRTVATRPG